MKIDRSHFPWLLFVVLATLASALLYLANYFPQRLPVTIPLPSFFGETPPTRHTFGGTPLGLLLGSGAFAIFLFAAALGIRKKKRLWPIGNVQFWLKAHIWLTVLTIPLVLFHCGFRSGGLHTTWLVILYAVVMASGFLGLALQQFMPRLMKERLPREVVFEQIPHFRRLLLEAATKIRRGIETGAMARPVASAVSSGPAGEDPSAQTIRRFLDEECLPYLAAERGDRHRLGNDKAATDRFRTLNLNVAREWQPIVGELQLACTDRRLMDLQTKYQHWLHGWLVIHVPASFALLVFTAWHAWVALRFLVIS
jgi:hypothetical protein